MSFQLPDEIFNKWRKQMEKKSLVKVEVAKDKRKKK